MSLLHTSALDEIIWQVLYDYSSPDDGTGQHTKVISLLMYCQDSCMSDIDNTCTEENGESYEDMANC